MRQIQFLFGSVAFANTDVLLSMAQRTDCSFVPPVEGPGQYWICNDNKSLCGLSCAAGYHSNNIELYIKCVCQNDVCFFVRKHLEYSDNMKFLIDPGFIEETGFQCNISTNERNLPHFDAPIRIQMARTELGSNQRPLHGRPIERRMMSRLVAEPTTSYNCQYIMAFIKEATWLCDSSVNNCALRCNDINFQPETFSITCSCTNIGLPETCSYWINGRVKEHSQAEITETYSNFCTPHPVEKCGDLPIAQHGKWQCDDDACHLECEGNRHTVNQITIECQCNLNDDCRYVKVAPKWLNQYRKLNFEPGWEDLDGFKCHPRESTPTPDPVVPSSCSELSPPELEMGQWICSANNNYCAFTCPTNFLPSRRYWIECKCRVIKNEQNSKHCHWQKSISSKSSMESNDFSSGWMDVDKLHCKASKIPSISLKSSITKKIDGLCTLPQLPVDNEASWVCDTATEYNTCFLGCPQGKFKNRQVKISCFCDEEKQCEYKLFNSRTKYYSKLETNYWLQQLNFKCETK